MEVPMAAGPRVTLRMIEAAVAEELYATGDQLASSSAESLKTFTMCFLVMKNGFIVVGHSAPAAPENFDPELGRKLAREHALRQLWPLMGYALRERLSAEAD